MIKPIFESLNVTKSINYYQTFLADEWKFHRRLVSPTINQAKVCMHLPIFNRNIRETISNLRANGDFFDILPIIAKCTMTTIVEAALGTDWEPTVKQQYLQQLITYVLHEVRHVKNSSYFKILPKRRAIITNM